MASNLGVRATSTSAATLSPVRLQQFRAATLQQRARNSRRRLWSVACWTIGVAVLDIYGITLGSANARYALVVLPIFAIVVARSPMNRLTIRPLSSADLLLLALFLLGTTGSIVAILLHTARSPALGLFLPMSMGLLHLTTLGHLEEDEAARNLRRLTVLMSLYVAIHAASALGLLAPLGGGGANPAASVAGAVFGHEKGFLLCTALAAAWLTRRRRLTVALVALSFVTFVAYPAATYLVAAVVTVMTLVATGQRATRTRAYLLAGLCLGFLALVVSEVSTSAGGATSSLSSSYFRAVDKSDNNETRADLWSQAWAKTLESPVFGSGFAGDTALQAVLDGKRSEVPPHNDFLQMGMGGGFLGMGLLAGWVVVTNVVAFRRFRLVRSLGKRRAATLLRVLLVGYNCFFAIALLNPVMSRFGLSVIAMLFYSMMMTVGASGVASHSLRPAGQASPS